MFKKWLRRKYSNIARTENQERKEGKEMEKYVRARKTSKISAYQKLQYIIT